MDLRAVRYFVAVAEAGSFTGGANKAHVVQSAASAAVARLERELGVALFVRAGRRIEITEAGRVLLVHARHMIAAAEAARDDIGALSEGLQGVVTLGQILTTGRLDLATVVADFRRTHPRVRVHMRLSAHPMYNHLGSVLDGTFDLLLAPMPPHLPSYVQMDEVAEAEIVAVCGLQHPLAAAVDVGLDEVAGYDQIDFPAGWGNRELVDQAFQQADVQRTVAIEVVDVASALTLAAGNAGVAFVSRQFVDFATDIATVPLAHPLPTVRLGVAVAARHPPAAAVGALRDAILRAASGGEQANL